MLDCGCWEYGKWIDLIKNFKISLALPTFSIPGLPAFPNISLSLPSLPPLPSLPSFPNLGDFIPDINLNFGPIFAQIKQMFIDFAKINFMAYVKCPICGQ